MEKAAGAMAPSLRYDHQALEPRRRILRWVIDNIGWRFLVRIGCRGLNTPRDRPVSPSTTIAFVDPVVVLGIYAQCVRWPRSRRTVPLIGMSRLWVDPVRRAGRPPGVTIRDILAAGRQLRAGGRQPGAARRKEAACWPTVPALVVPIAVEARPVPTTLQVAGLRPDDQVTSAAALHERPIASGCGDDG
jgi:hypothetical protein